MSCGSYHLLYSCSIRKEYPKSQKKKEKKKKSKQKTQYRAQICIAFTSDNPPIYINIYIDIFICINIASYFEKLFSKNMQIVIFFSFYSLLFWR